MTLLAVAVLMLATALPVAARPRPPGGWTATGSMADARSSSTATLLPNGQLLIAGGYNYGADISIAGAETYDAGTGTWTVTGSMVAPRRSHVAVLLRTGKVLVAGGDVPGEGVGWATAELYDPVSRTWARRAR